MKSRPTQFGVRENTASSRQHAPRRVVGWSLPEPERRTVNECAEKQSAPQFAASMETFPEPLTEHGHGATGGKGTPPEGHQRRKRHLEGAETAPITARGLVGIHAAAEFLAVSVSTLYGWVWQRRIPFIKVGRAVRFDTADLQAFVEENRIHAKPARKL